MLEPELVREIVSSMVRQVSVPVTVKCRIGADDKDSYSELVDFVKAASAGGARKVILHSRKCLLKGLTTKQNRDVPPLKYEVVHNLVKDFPELTFILNGGIQDFQSATSHLEEGGWAYQRTADTLNVLMRPKTGCVDLAALLWGDVLGLPDATAAAAAVSAPPTVFAAAATTATSQPGNSVHTAVPAHALAALATGQGGAVLLPPVHGIMIGRAAFSDPMLLATADSTFFGAKDPGLTRRQVLMRYLDYCEWVQSDDGPKKKSSTVNSKNPATRTIAVSTSALLRPVQNFMTGLRGVGTYRRRLNDLYDAQLARETGGGAGPNPREIVRFCVACRQTGVLTLISTPPPLSCPGLCHAFVDRGRDGDHT
jgi:tRNA-dihydrouridine synthase